MRQSNVVRWAGAAAILVTGCGTAPRTAPQPDPTLVIHEPSIRVIRDDPGGIARARADSMRAPWTAADARFMTHMIPHHAQAITMSRMATSHGASVEVRRLAARIINAQQDEIALMQQWLADRRQPVPEAHTHMMSGAAAGDHAQHEQHMREMQGHANMPGMLSEAQLKQLDAARGREFDRLFLSFMIQHHKGAVTMVKELLATHPPQDEIAFRLAADVNVDQTTEIARMESMLAAMKP